MLYDELKMIFQAEDDHGEFIGFDQSENTISEITFLNEKANQIDLVDIFESDSEDSNEFFGFTNEESVDTDLARLFLDDSTDTEFTGF